MTEPRRVSDKFYADSFGVSYYLSYDDGQFYTVATSSDTYLLCLDA